MASQHAAFLHTLLRTREDMEQIYPHNGPFGIPQEHINQTTAENLYAPPLHDTTDHAIDALRYAGSSTDHFLATEPQPTYRWINNIHERVNETQENADRIAQRRNLISCVNIYHDPLGQHYTAQLGNEYLRHNTHHYTDLTTNDQAIREMLIEQIINNHMERNPMPYTTTGTGTGTTTTSHNLFHQAPPAPTHAPPIFTIQQNTQAIELDRLHNRYPAEIFTHNFQASSVLALHGEREQIREKIYELKRMKAMLFVIKTLPRKYRDTLDTILLNQFTSRQRRELEHGIVEELSSYLRTIEALTFYKDQRALFSRNKTRYSSQQAEYNQRAAMIRQKPNIPKTIDTQQILETILQWENVWGVAVKKSIDGEGLYIRIGLCDIVMQESAPNSKYNNPKNIMLAPSYFTLNLKNDGRFICRSGQNHTKGLSVSYNIGALGYDFHPHQLSDAPCYGSFGQTLIELATHGETIPLISGIIAFYSQYNSEDSAGVNARNYHPSRLSNINSPADYATRLFDRLTRWNYREVNKEKLDAAILRYTEYHERERHEHAPETIIEYFCYSCETRDVSDNTDYCVDVNGERICQGCWGDHYCSECERHSEECSCEQEEY